MSTMRALLFLFIISTVSNRIQAQSFWEYDSVPNKQRIMGAHIGAAVLGGGSLIGLTTIWYKDNWNPEGFTLFNDGKEWLQMDKFGHFYTAHHIAAGLSKVYQWGGVSPQKSRLLGSAISLGYLTSIEILDGFSKDYGFSWWDMAANGLGIGWYLTQESLWEEQRIHLKFSASPSPYASFRPSHLGSTVPERLLKDYNGQTYWLSFSPGHLFKKRDFFPKWLAVSAGYSIDQKLHGFDNTFTVLKEDKLYQFEAKRQYLLSLDIDLTALPIEKPWLKTLAYALNHVKVPFPTVVYNQGGGMYFNWMYF